MPGDTSPVNAPLSAQWTFWAATAISVPASASTAACERDERRADGDVDPVELGKRSRSSRQNSCVSAGPLKSFQFPATSGTEGDLKRLGSAAWRRRPDRNLALELVRVTEAAAMAAGRWVGRGDKIAADQAAVDGMRTMLDIVSMQGTVVIGEGEKDEAPMLYNGEAIGNGEGPEVDVAVDPLEGTRLTANGAPNAIAVIALADKGTMFFPGAAVYMDKIVVGPAAADVIDIDAPPAENVRRTAEAKGMRAEDVTVVVLDRDRHADLIAELRERRRQGAADHGRRRGAVDRGGETG